ncbi:MAG: hypothetical protein RIG84_16240 [Roseovarius sp.]
MGKARWHIVEEPGALVLARCWPVRFDLAVATVLPAVARRARLAQQVRQDMWRALRGLRGFSPAVRLEEAESGLRVVAGGQVDGPLPRAKAEAQIADLLACPRNRARWARWAS